MSERIAAVLAGGKSSRMGRPKAWVEVGGQPLLRRVVDRLRPHFGRVLVVGAKGQDLPETASEPVSDLWPDRGPLGGLATALRYLKDETPDQDRSCALVACDMPLVSAELLAAMVDQLGDAAAAVPVAEGRPQPLHAVYSTRALAQALDRVACETLGMTRFCLGLRPTLWDEERWRALDPTGRCFMNANRLEDLAGLE